MSEIKGCINRAIEAWDLMRIGHPDAVGCMNKAQADLKAFRDALPKEKGVGEFIEAGELAMEATTND